MLDCLDRPNINNMVIIRNMCHMHFSLVYKRVERIDLKEKNRKQMYDQIKVTHNSQRIKFTAIFIFCYKKILI